MATVASMSGWETADVLQLCDTYRRLDAKRADIDQRVMSLPADDADRDILWRRLGPLLTTLREVIDRLAKAPATNMSQLRAKAGVLAMLLRERDSCGGSIVPECQTTALALALADAIVGWSE
jgi:hypothetical protein